MSTKPSKLPEWDTTQVNAIEPTTERKEQGWLAPGGVPEKPPFQTFNYWQNEVYRWLKSINDQGILEYDNLTDYTANLSFAVGSDGLLYACKINNGPSSSVVDPVGDLTGTWIVSNSDLWAQNNVLHAQDRKAPGTGGGASVAGIQNRSLNTEITNTITGATLLASVVTLPAGRYIIKGSASAFRVDSHQSKFVNIDDAITVAVGITSSSGSTDLVMTHSEIPETEFVISATKQFRLQHYMQTSNASNGFGTNSNSGEDEIYSYVYIERVGEY